ncbi:LysR substrate-binding domain-containing protein [Ruegeria marina]|uniref:LysR substrate-binding domain-containing protein n=1 Tax=Ruegeria marina TaxID=639004 RepID=UPI000B80918E|nr:LysR substrate-binding domain-containing protein [Ruegeria marina]
MHLSQIPLNALRAFDATARHGSFTAAAQELCVTPGAVARQVHLLEDRFSVQLVTRKGPQITLTTAGVAALPSLRRGFEELQRSVAEIRRATETPSITLSADTTFAAMWLAPRLKEFHEAEAPARVRIVSQTDIGTTVPDYVDIIVSSFLPCPPGFSEQLLHKETLIPVMSPKLFEQLRPKAPADLARADLIVIDAVVDDDANALGWPFWFAHHGVTLAKDAPMLQVSLNILAYQAAVTHQGVVLASHPLVREYLERGDLIAPFGPEYGIDVPRYAFVKETLASPLVERFLAWLSEHSASI